jgi:iron-sulfur cluster repair protein YtfE (RIC family)
MLFQLGKRASNADDGLLDALSACHHRIRLHVNLARQVATASDAGPDERSAAARAVRRYFTLALPLHIADEEEILTPFLAGRDSVVDEALRMMHDEHETHEHDVSRLIVLCHIVEHDPHHARARAELGAVAERLDAAFERHLALEEAIIFPALRRCSPADQRALHAVMQRRRQAPRATSTTAAK